MLAGVAGGVAETLDADPSMVRIVWALLAIMTGGIAVLVYIVMAIVVPEDPPEPWTPTGVGSGTGEASPASTPAASTPPGPATPTWGTAQPPSQTRAEWRASRRARRGLAPGTSDTGLIVGVVLIVIGALFLARQAIPWFDFHVWWPLGIIGLGVLLLAAAVRPRGPTA
jgi:phage shock protein C